MTRSIKFIAVLATIGILGGSGIADANSMNNNDSATKESRPVKTVAHDAAITTEINAKFVADDSVSALKINVDTRNGNVKLTGTANSEQARERAISIAKAVKGVVSVDAKDLKVNK
ncbi:MAG: hypothetical protein K0R98_1020 [Rickettsiaceae bacterium]|jgi:osmotically-inducible protein OsmY|nr:hypothetical protein [Rickettsiaceae bacterium]